MTNEIDALKAELAALRRVLEDPRVHFPEALVEGDLATERVTIMNRLACQVIGFSYPAAFNFGVAIRVPGETVSTVLSRPDQVMYAAKGRSLRSKRR